MGMIDYFRVPKRQWYWYRNEYRHILPPTWPVSGTPAALKLTADKTTLKSVDGTDDAATHGHGRGRGWQGVTQFAAGDAGDCFRPG